LATERNRSEWDRDRLLEILANTQQATRRSVGRDSMSLSVECAATKPTAAVAILHYTVMYVEFLFVRPGANSSGFVASKCLPIEPQSVHYDADHCMMRTVDDAAGPSRIKLSSKNRDTIPKSETGHASPCTSKSKVRAVLATRCASNQEGICKTVQIRPYTS
jgi:hypothetical protein